MMPAWAQILVALGACTFIFLMGFGCGKWGWPAGPRPRPDSYADPWPNTVNSRARFTVIIPQRGLAQVHCNTCHATEPLPITATVENRQVVAISKAWYAQHEKDHQR